MLNKISAINFMSWKQLDFNISAGVSLIDGWNEDDQRSEGSGKSSVLNALSWGLFGVLPKDTKIDEVIKDGETNCQVTLEFDNGDSITRSRKPNDVYLVVNNQIQRGKDAKETQTLIEEYIGYNFETFAQSIYFAQGYDKKFLNVSSTEKGTILSNIQNLQIFDKARKNTMDLLKLEEAKLTTLTNNLNLANVNLTNLQSQLNLVDQNILEKQNAFNRQKDYITKQVEQAEVAINIATIESNKLKEVLEDSNIEVFNDSIDRVSVDRNKLLEQIAQLNFSKSQQAKVQQDYNTKTSQGKTLAKQYEQIEKTVESLQNIDNNPTVKRLQTKIEQLTQYIQNPVKICPTCKQTVDCPDLSNSEKEVVDLQSELAGLYEKNTLSIQELNLNKENIVQTLHELGRQLDEFNLQSTEELDQALGQAQLDIKEIDNVIKSYKNEILNINKNTQQLDLKLAQLAQYEVHKTSLMNDLQNFGTLDLNKELIQKNNIIVELNKASQTSEELKPLIEANKLHIGRLTVLKEGFKEIKSYVFNNVLNELNIRANQYLTELFEVEAKLKFINEDQKISTDFILDGKTRSLGTLSGGQNRRFNLAVDLALSDIISTRKADKLNLICFDEYFRDLSEISMEKCLDLIKSRKTPVLIVEHNSIFKNIVDTVFFVKMIQGTTYGPEQ